MAPVLRSIVAIVLAATATLPLGAPTRGEAAPANGANVFVVGDSVLLGAADQIVAAMPRYRVTVDAEVSRTVLAAPALLRGRTDDVVVVSLGHNDGSGDFANRIDTVMGALAGVDHVIWLTQQEFRADRAGMNDELRAATARWPKLEVLDWQAVVTRTPDANWDDGLHLRPAGADAMAGAIAFAVELALTPTPMDLFAVAGAWSASGIAAVEHAGSAGRAPEGP